MAQINPYSDDYNQASEYLRLTLSFLAKHKIPASPLNYHIGYELVSGTNQALKKALAELISQSGIVNESSLLEFYNRFISQEDAALEAIRQELQMILADIHEGYDQSSGNLKEYLGSLNKFSKALSGSGHSENLVGEVQKVLAGTRSTEQSQRKIESQMSGMIDEVESLRQQLEKVKEESLTDALTGLANRKAFDQEMEQVIQDSTENNTPFCVLISDIDHFKKFNDTYGHLVGDKVLRFVSATIKACVKGKDTAARFGGEEFVVILPDTNMTGGAIVAEQIRKAISSGELRDKAKKEHYGTVTISLGVGEFIPGEQSLDMIKKADDALYRAKENGRNRVEKAL